MLLQRPTQSQPPGSRRWRGLLLVTLIAGLWYSPALADALSTLPQAWSGRLEPVAEADISGAEPLMQQALREARGAVARLLKQPSTPPRTLGRAYGRLGARLMLVEVETQADACLRNAMALDPEELRWPYYAGYMAMLAGNLDAALRYLRQAQEIDADYPPLYLRLGKVQLDRGDLPAARSALARVADDPRLRSPAQYYLGQIALLERRFADARDHLLSALDANAEATEVHYPLARAYQGLGEDAQAKVQLQRFELRSPEIADPLLDELRTSTQRALPLFERALHAVHRGDYASAEARFTEGLAVDPGNAAARLSYARVLYLRGERSAAEQALEEVLKTASASVDRPPEQRRSTLASAHFFLGVLHQADGDEAAAVQDYRRALERDPEHAGALFQLANLQFAAGRYADAAANYRATLGADPSAAPAALLALIAEAHAGAPEPELAERITRLREAAPNDDQRAYAQARLLAASTDPDVRDAAAAMEIAVELAAKGPIPPHRRLLALADAAAGEMERALHAQSEIIATQGWMAPAAERALMERERDQLRAGMLPQPAWPEDDPLLAPPPFDATRVFRDYPAATPY